MELLGGIAVLVLLAGFMLAGGESPGRVARLLLALVLVGAAVYGLAVLLLSQVDIS